MFGALRLSDGRAFLAFACASRLRSFAFSRSQSVRLLAPSMPRTPAAEWGRLSSLPPGLRAADTRFELRAHQRRAGAGARVGCDGAVRTGGVRVRTAAVASRSHVRRRI